MRDTRPATAFWIVHSRDTLTDIVKKSFGVTSQTDINAKIASIVLMNPHIKNANLIKVGQVIKLASDDPFSPPVVDSAEMDELSRLLTPTDPQAAHLVENWETVHALTQNGPYQQVPPEVEAALSAATVGKWVFKGTKGMTKTLDKAVEGKFGNFLKVSPHNFRSVEGEVVRNVQKDLRYLKNADGSLGIIPKATRAFSLGEGKVVLIRPDAQGGLYSFSRSVRKSKELGRKLFKPAQKVFKVIDFGMAGYDMYEAYHSAESGKNMSKVAGKFGTGLLFGAVSGGVATGVCGFLTFTTGVGGVICFATVIIVGGVAAGELGEWAGEEGYLFFKSNTAPLLIN